MKTDTMLLVGALAVAAGLVLLPRRAGAASAPSVATPRVGGTAGSLWNDTTTAQYREQLARETAGAGWYGP